MNSQADPSSSSRISSNRIVWFSSIAGGLVVFGLAAFLQWLIYDDWLHDHGPLRVVGSALAGLLTFAFIFQARRAAQRRAMERAQRAEAIRLAHDRVRNSLQTIECITYAHDPRTTEPVKSAVDTIERTLEETLLDSHLAIPPAASQRSGKGQEMDAGDALHP